MDINRIDRLFGLLQAFNGEKDTKLIIDSLNCLLNDIILENGIHEIYLPLKVCNIR